MRNCSEGVDPNTSIPGLWVAMGAERTVLRTVSGFPAGFCPGVQAGTLQNQTVSHLGSQPPTQHHAMRILAGQWLLSPMCLYLSWSSAISS